VDLPWSMCAMMQKLRMNFGSIVIDYRLERLLSNGQSMQRKNRAV